MVVELQRVKYLSNLIKQDQHFTVFAKQPAVAQARTYDLLNDGVQNGSYVSM
jgi:hypothetical protein